MMHDNHVQDPIDQLTTIHREVPPTVNGDNSLSPSSQKMVLSGIDIETPVILATNQTSTPSVSSTEENSMENLIHSSATPSSSDNLTTLYLSSRRRNPQLAVKTSNQNTRYTKSNSEEKGKHPSSISHKDKVTMFIKGTRVFKWSSLCWLWIVSFTRFWITKRLFPDPDSVWNTSHEDRRIGKTAWFYIKVTFFIICALSLFSTYMWVDFYIIHPNQRRSTPVEIPKLHIAMKIDSDLVERQVADTWDDYFGDRKECIPLEIVQYNTEDDNNIRMSTTLTTDITAVPNTVVLYDDGKHFIHWTEFYELFAVGLSATTRFGWNFATPRMYLPLVNSTSYPPCMCLFKSSSQDYTIYMINPMVTLINMTNSREISFKNTMIKSEQQFTQKQRLPGSLSITYYDPRTRLNKDLYIVQQKTMTFTGLDVAKALHCLFYMSKSTQTIVYDHQADQL